MTKKNRLKLIREIIENHKVATQDDLITHLKAYNVDVTQTTISRDLNELNLTKVRDAYGVYYYSLPLSMNSGEFAAKFLTILRESVISLASSGNILVIKCYTGMGNAACAALDTMHLPEIIGTIAGDDTIFAVIDSSETCETLIGKINAMIRS